MGQANNPANHEQQGEERASYEQRKLKMLVNEDAGLLPSLPSLDRSACQIELDALSHLITGLKPTITSILDYFKIRSQCY